MTTPNELPLGQLPTLEPAHRFVEHEGSRFKVHQHTAGSTGATAVADYCRCPRLAALTQAGPSEDPMTRFVLARGQMVHTLLLHQVLRTWGSWPDWAPPEAALAMEMAELEQTDKATWRSMARLRKPEEVRGILVNAVRALTDLGVQRVVFAEEQVVVPLGMAGPYTPRLDLGVELADGTLLLLDWKTTTMEPGAVREEALFYGASTQFQGMFLAGRRWLAQQQAAKPLGAPRVDAPLRVGVGVIRFIKNHVPLVEIHPIKPLNQDLYARRISKALEGLALLRAGATPEPIVGASSCHGPYGACKLLEQCHG